MHAGAIGLGSQPSRRRAVHLNAPSCRLHCWSVSGFTFLRRVLAAPSCESREDAAKEDSLAKTATFQTAGGVGEFDFHRFDVYRVALEFQALVPQLQPAWLCCAARSARPRQLVDPAEHRGGHGRFARADKAQFYLIARGSTTECAAVLDVLVTRGLILAVVHRHAHDLLIRVTQMLTKLILRMQA